MHQIEILSPPPEKTTLPTGILPMKFAPYMYRLQQITILQAKQKNVVSFQNGGQITTIFILRHFAFGQHFEQPLSQRNFFNQIWLKEEEYE